MYGYLFFLIHINKKKQKNKNKTKKKTKKKNKKNPESLVP